ncbi:MAG TPA: ParA family protein [Hyphomicrobiaceae bacterium]|nr:ParA family protein [Hyphomicrobiaceae bacterium]
MHASIAVMNTKGGVGKSTLVLALAETLTAIHGKTVLVIDSDSQASVSAMLMSVASLHKLQSEGLTIVDYLVAAVLKGEATDWSRFVVGNVSDVDDARSLYVLPSDMQLTLFEREVSKESLHGRLRSAIGALLADVSRVFDVVLIDCPPGLSVLTESWLREARFHISPTKPDYVSVCGLEVFRRFKALNPEMGFAENLGVIVNMKDMASPVDAEYHRWLADNPENRCFSAAVPRMGTLQDAARFRTPDRSFMAKYPGPVGHAIRALADEVLARGAAAIATPGAVDGRRTDPTARPAAAAPQQVGEVRSVSEEGSKAPA